MSDSITLGDVVPVASSIDSCTIDCILADPPYNIGKDFGNNNDTMVLQDYVEWMKKCLQEFKRIIKPSGTMFIYGFDEILAHISVNVSMNHRWLIWYYTNKNTSKATFWQRSHESIIAAWKDTSSRIFNADEVREPYTETFLTHSAGKTRANTFCRLSKKGITTTYNAHEMGAMGRDVIKVPALAGGAGSHERIFFCSTCDNIFMGNKKHHRAHSIIEHPTQKPMALTEKLLKSCLPHEEGKFSGKVYIPFAGSGSECFCCKKMGISFVSSDTNAEYVKYGNMLLSIIS
jgi:site-specific DNA-methyltransferase (adenine-specific)